MRTLLLCVLLLFLFPSCLVVKIYQSPETVTEEERPAKVVHRSMISSGKTIDLGDKGKHEILFFGEDKTPKKLFFRAEDSLLPSDSLVSKKENIWITEESKDEIKIITDETSQPLLLIDGQESKDHAILQALKPETIESINVLKGAAAEKIYGEKGSNGVIEITLKKE